MNGSTTDGPSEHRDAQHCKRSYPNQGPAYFIIKAPEDTPWAEIAEAWEQGEIPDAWEENDG